MTRGRKSKSGGNQNEIKVTGRACRTVKRHQKISTIVALGIALSMLVSGVILAQRGRSGQNGQSRLPVTSQQELSQTVAPASFSPGNPSKEFIYAGSRLLVTEQPANAITHLLTVSSQSPSSGVTIAASPNDTGGMGAGSTPFSRSYGPSTVVTLTAPATAGGNNFQKWRRNGADLTTNQTANVTVEADLTMTAVYAAAAGAGTDTIGLYDPAAGVFYLSNTNSSAPAGLVFSYGPAAAGWLPIAGDWNGDRVVTIGLFNPGTSTFFLSNSNSSAAAAIVFDYGPAGAGWLPISGDWNGDGIDTIGLYQPSTSIFFLRNSNSTGTADLTFSYGPAGGGWLPVAGDWNGDGVDTIGLYDPAAGAYFLRHTNSTAPADLVFSYGPPGAGWIPIIGDWNGDGIETIGLYDPAASNFFLRNTNTSGPADVTFSFGPAGAGWKPVIGNWDGL